MDLSQYLVPYVSEWLVKNILQQPILLSEFIKLNIQDRILYISPDFHFIYTFSELNKQIYKYDLFTKEANKITIPQDGFFPFLQSIQHPQWIGFFKTNHFPFFTLYLIDITTGETIHNWIVHDLLHGYERFRYTWDEKLRLLIT